MSDQARTAAGSSRESRKRPKPKSKPARRHEAHAARTRVVLVTGMSGAGRSLALKTLEDIGYEAVDNLPISLLSRIVRPPAAPKTGTRRGASARASGSGAGGRQRALAIGVDIRTRDFGIEPFLAELDQLIAHRELDVHLLFLESSVDALLRRYTETRRRHPLAVDRPVRDGIIHERRLLSRLRARADRVIDTSDFSASDLRRLLEGAYRLDRKGRLAVCVSSFSYRQGVPREADLVFDVRFLRNPHYVPQLRPHTGLDEDVGNYILSDLGFNEFYTALTGLLNILLPRYEQEGKSYLTIAVGCTGGRHRSVFVAERLARWLRENGSEVGVVHRDITEEEAAATTLSAVTSAEQLLS